MNEKLNRKFWVTIKKNNIGEDTRGDLIYDYTDGRTRSSKDISDEEARGLIDSIQARFNTQDNIPDSLRKQLIAMSCSIGEDVAFVEGWCEKYGVYGVKKKFNDYSSNELIALREKFEKVVADRKRSVTRK